MAYRLLWAGRLWSITVPEELGSSAAVAWTYAQTYVVTGGSVVAAMTRALELQYPGLGYGSPNLTPVSFAAVGAPAAADDVCASGKSAPYVRQNRDSQRPRPPFSRQGEKGAVSGTSGPRKPTPRPATSSASQPLFRASMGSSLAKQRESLRSSKQTATQDTGGWLGSNSTTGKALRGVPVA